jgi:FG-GAP-like repeat
MSRPSCFVALLLALISISAVSEAQLQYKVTFNYQTPNQAISVANGDFNRDGKPDFALLQPPVVSVLFNLGSGKFGNQRDTTVPADAFPAATADVNRDGRLDLLIGQSNTPAILVYMGNGDGTFKSPLSVALTVPANGFALGDLNNDGKLDLAASECTSYDSPCDIAVYFGDGGGNFLLTKIINTPAGTSENLVVTDFNRDGKLDLAVAARGPSRGLVFFGYGNGEFKPAKELPVTNPIPADSVESSPNLTDGDFNGDGVPDLAVMAGYRCGGSACGGANITTFLSNGAGGFTLKYRWNDTNAFGPERMYSMDLNNDLRQDLYTYNGSPWVGQIYNWIGQKDGSLKSFSSNFYPSTPSWVESRDMDLDARHDMIVADWMGGAAWVAVNQNGSPNCPPPGSDNTRAKICSVAATSTAGTYVVKASGNSVAGIKRLELWIDGKKKYEVLNDQIQYRVALTPGTHRVVVAAVDKYIGYSKTEKIVSIR